MKKIPPPPPSFSGKIFSSGPPPSPPHPSCLYNGVGFGQRVGATDCFEATLERVCASGDKDFPETPLVEGFFSENGGEKLTFNWNIGDQLPNHVRASSYKNNLPRGLSLNTPLSVRFSVRSTTDYSKGAPFPSPVFPRTPGAFPLVAPVENGLGLLPPPFLKDLVSLLSVQAHIAIGIPDNDVIPTLDLEAFGSFLRLAKPLWPLFIYLFTPNIKNCTLTPRNPNPPF